MDRTDEPITATHPVPPAGVIAGALRTALAFSIAYSIDALVWSASAAVGIVAMALLPHTTDAASSISIILAVLSAYGFNTLAFALADMPIPGFGFSADDVAVVVAQRVYGESRKTPGGVDPIGLGYSGSGQ